MKITKGFTLIELLIVIAILAILATVVTLALNPAEYFKQTRDTQRMNDLDSLKNAVNLYLSTVSGASLNTTTTCTIVGCVNGANSSSTIPMTIVATSSYQGYNGSLSASVAVDGTGWVPVNFGNMSGGSPLNKLPIDPTNTTTSPNFYAYYGNNGSSTFELDARLESSKNSSYMSNDGGNNSSWYEVGTYLSF